MAHETAVHRAGAGLAAGLRPAFAPDLAADAIEEWLGVLCGPAPGERDRRLQALPGGAVLRVHATGSGPGGDGQWMVRRQGSRVLDTNSPAPEGGAASGTPTLSSAFTC